MKRAFDAQAMLQKRSDDNIVQQSRTTGMTDNVAPSSAAAMSPRKQALRRLHDDLASQRVEWIERARYFHEEDLRYLKFLIQVGARVLELGCGTGHLLAALKPSIGVGVDFSPSMIAEARRTYPHL